MYSFTHNAWLANVPAEYREQFVGSVLAMPIKTADGIVLYLEVAPLHELVAAKNLMKATASPVVLATLDKCIELARKTMSVNALEIAATMAAVAEAEDQLLLEEAGS